MPKELSIVMPCLNEAETLAVCIKKAQLFFESANIDGEVIIADNGSSDGSRQIAETHGAVVIQVPKKGYGSALKGGIDASSGNFIIMGDADDSYDFSNLSAFVAELRNGSDLVIGNRFKGGIKRKAMPKLHKYLGNPVLSFLGRLFFNSPIRDFHCGLRGFTKDAFNKMQLTTGGMEFASEMIVKAHLMKMVISEVPTILYPDGRSRKPHLKTWSDGWRHLRFLLLYSPRWLFLIPGLILMILGFVVSTILIINPVKIESVTFDIHTLLYSTSVLMIGFQFVVFYGFTKVYAVTQKLLPRSDRYDWLFGFINLERGLIAGFLMTVAGAILTIYGLTLWSGKEFGPLETRNTFRIIIPAVTLIVIGVQVILFSFFFSILGLRDEKN